jgi:hypothetical protein
MKPSFAYKLQNIDRRILYIVLLGIVILGLIFPMPLPLIVGPTTKQFFEAIETAPTDKIAIISTTWSSSTQGENRPQNRIVLEHLMRRKIRFALLAFEPQSTNLAQEIAEELGQQYHYVYGKDWVNLGYRADVPGTLKAMMQDIVQTFKKDSREHRPLETLPVMAGVKSLRDAGVMMEIGASGNYKYWVQFVVGAAKAPFAYGPTSVMAPELYSYIDSKQITGMMFGIKGAAEYEKLLNVQGFTTRAIGPVSLSLIFLFVLIGLGNWGMFLGRKSPPGVEDET